MCNCLLSIRLSFLLIVGIPFLADGQTGPGGVGNSTTNKIWLKADEGILESVSNAGVGMWVDQSGNNFNFNQTLNANNPSYQLNGLNGQPYIHFDRTAAVQYLQLTLSGVGTLLSNSNTIFIVGKANSGAADNSTNSHQSFFVIPGYHSGITVAGYSQAGSVYMTNWVGATVPGPPPTTRVTISSPITQGNWNFLTRRIAENSNGTSQSGFLNGALISSVTKTMQMTTYNQNLVRIGAGFTSGDYTWGLNGDISEIIVYNRAVNEAERIIIENYLSSKYNHPIENDKFEYDGSNEYVYNVAGIGRADISNTNLSANSSILNINAQSSLEDGEYILVGHNGQALSLNDTDAPAGMKRLHCTWRADLTGNPGTVSISFDVNNFSLMAGQNFHLLVDSDGTFSNATDYTGTVVNGVFTVSMPVSIIDGDFLTLAYSQNAPSAPVSLSYEPNQGIKTYGNNYTTLQPHAGNGGATTTFSLVNPPIGVTINPTSGTISTNETTPVGVHSLTVSLNNVYGASVFSDVYTLTVYPYAASEVNYPSQTVSFGNAIDPIFPNLPPNAFQYALASGSLNGLNLNNSTGEISGVLQSEGTAWALIRATPIAPNATGTSVTAPLVVSAIGTSGPGGIGSTLHNKIWLDAEYQTGLANGARVTTLLDRSGNGWHAVQSTASRKPTFLLNQLNGKPVIRFNRTSTIQCMEMTASGIGAVMSNSNTMFVIGKANTGAWDNETNKYQALIAAPGYHSTISFSGYPTTNGTFIINYVGGIIPGNATSTFVSKRASFDQGTWQMISRTMTETSTTILNGFLNGEQMGGPAISDMQMTKYNTDLVRIGSAYLSGSHSWPLNGDIAEIIVYKVSLNDPQRIIIENYLSAKYNLPIANDKYTLNDAAYILDVEGIGTTDATNSNKHFKASNRKGLIMEEVNSSLNTADEFLLAGHASNSNAVVNTDLPISVSERWQRIWYLQKTGAIDAKLTFDISDAGLIVPADLANVYGYYQLLYRSSTNGSFVIVPAVPMLENDDQISFTLTNDQLMNGYYTLGNPQGLVWTGAQDQQWNEPANWSLNRIPTKNDNVVINNCATCPKLSYAVTIASLQLNSGSILDLDNKVLTIGGIAALNEAQVKSSEGKLQASDFLEVKNSVFNGVITLEKTGGTANSCYGGNTFSPELKIINSSDSGWQVSTQADNVIQTP